MELLIPIVLIAVGVALIFIEVYLVPGLNVVGIAGGLMIFFAVGYSFSHFGTSAGLLTLGSAIVVTGGGFWYLWRSGAWDKFVLSANLKADEGTVSRESEQRARVLGKTGLAVTPLRPTGVAEIEGDRIEVVTEGDFIAAGSHVKVVAMDRRKFFVRLTNDESDGD